MVTWDKGNQGTQATCSLLTPRPLLLPSLSLPPCRDAHLALTWPQRQDPGTVAFLVVQRLRLGHLPLASSSSRRPLLPGCGAPMWELLIEFTLVKNVNR